MKPCKLVLAVAAVTLLLVSVLSSFPLCAQAASTLIVPDNYSTITDAVENAFEGDTILVRAGVYYENPIVNKPLTLIGDNCSTVVIGEGGVERGGRAVFTLASDNITLLGFTIQSQNYSKSTEFATAIKVEGDNCTIAQNNIEGTYYGVFCSVQISTKISDNNITATLKDGVRICGGSYNTISDNKILGNAKSGIAIDGYLDTIVGNNLVNNQRGIGLGASYSVVFGNTITDNSESGIYLGASDCIITSNSITNSSWGVHFTSYFAAPNNNIFYHNNFQNNTQHAGTTSIYNSQIWDDGSEGNYWSDTVATDSTYTVYDGNIDHHPKTEPFNLTQEIPPSLPVVTEALSSDISVWHFDEVAPNGETPDALGNNPVVLEPSGGGVFTPLLVEGKLENALQFNGTDYAYVTASPTLNINGEFTIDAWLNVKEFKDVAYSNIVVECLRTPEKYPTRIFGFAFNGQQPTNSDSVPLGALRGFLLDDEGLFHEIVTTQAVISLDNWFHVVLVRSLDEGMKIFVDGQEQAVKVLSGVQNPTGSIARGTEFYIGHDSVSIIDEVTLSCAALEPEDAFSFPLEFGVGTVAIIALVVCVGLWLLRKRRS